MSRTDYEEFIGQEALDLRGKAVYAYISGFPLKDIPRGYHVYNIVSSGYEYKVVAQDGEVLLETLDDTILKYYQPYDRIEKPYMVEVPREKISKELNVMRELALILYHKYSFGGGAPYENALEKLTVGDLNARPIGEAVVGETLIIT